MAKITQEQRGQYSTQVKEFNKKIDALQSEEEALLLVLKQPGTQGGGYVRMQLAEKTLVLTSYYILLNALSVSLLGIKSEDALGEARKTIGRSLKYIEDIVTGYIDVPFSDYEKELEAISEIKYEARYTLLHTIGFAISEIEDAYGSSSKWKWSFVELWGKIAAIAKNSLNLKQVYKDLELTSQNREIASAYLSFVKQMLQLGADRYREKYEMFSSRPEDFKQAIQFLSALRRIHMIFGERDDADELKKKIEIWSRKLDNDEKKRDEEQKRR